MRVLYSILVQLAWYFLNVVALFNPKIKKFVRGRRETFGKLSKNIAKSDRIIWFHAASLGEYEQGLPVLERLKECYPTHKFLLTFFSPSGYEVKKDKTPADLVTYLPMDTFASSKKFIDYLSPEIAIFIKYEIWPNYLYHLNQKQVPTFLISALFSKDQVYFKWYGGFIRRALKSFTHFFVQEKESKKLLNDYGLQNVSVNGDTRFDRVTEILSQENSLDFMERFKGDQKCFVAGSTWPEDEKVLLDFINTSRKKIKVVIAPHNIKKAHLEDLKSSIFKKVMLYSEVGQNDARQAEVLVIDTIGLLTKIYSYADFAYVGGGFATGLHNTLEPAVFGIPVVIGPKYESFNEAVELVDRKGLLSISNRSEFAKIMEQLLNNEEYAQGVGDINKQYILEKVGATDSFVRFIKASFKF